MKKRIISLLLAVLLVLTCAPAAFAANVGGFKDVKDTDWYAQEVLYAVENGLFTGTSDTTFSPKGQMTRAMFVTVLARMHGVDTSTVKDNGKFDDVKFASWYGPSVIWASDNGIVNGTSATKFSPNANVTRQDIAVMLYRYLTVMNIEVPNAPNAIASFKDADKISGYAAEAVDAMRKWGFFGGDTNGNMNPRSHITRAEAATLLMRVHYFIENGKHYPTEEEENSASFSATKSIVITTSESYPDMLYEEDNIWEYIKITDSVWGLEDEKIPMSGIYPYTFKSSDTSVVKVDGCGGLYSPVKLGMSSPDKTATITVTNTEDGTTQKVLVTVTPEKALYVIDDQYITDVGKAILKYMNEYRAENGLPALEYMPGDDAQPALNARALDYFTNPNHGDYIASEYGYTGCTWKGEARLKSGIGWDNGKPCSTWDADETGKVLFESHIKAASANILSDAHTYFGYGFASEYIGNETVTAYAYEVLVWGFTPEKYAEIYG